ncbi:MAG: hypothetical protein K9M54_06910, partial [Kiritimatiellales bacterium]|nr:hypothetical protein [Kiritimatiellales bacterium]
LIGGALRTWLDGNGGSYSGSGSYAGSNFTVLNGDGKDWTLSLADGNQDLTLTVSGGPLGIYAAWAASYGLADTNGTGAMTADPDGDWVDNLSEYGLGGNPTNSGDQGHVPTSGLLADGGTNWLEYVYYERSDKAALGLDYYPERSLDLGFPGWTNSGIVVAGTGTLDAEFNTVTNRISTESEGKQFVRLRIQIQ